MINYIKRFIGIVFTLTLMLAGSDAMARAPRPTSIPTHSEWGVIILSTLLALVAVFILRRQRQ